jgi:hypothetical protein
VTAYTNRRFRRRNIKDGAARTGRREDVAQKFDDAEFDLISHNIFRLQAHGQTFTVSPSWAGLKVSSACLGEPRYFPYSTAPVEIADFCVRLAKKEMD